MRCYLGLSALKAMRLQAFYNDAYNGDVSVDVLQILNGNTSLEEIIFNDEIIQSLHEEFANKLFYIENYILQLRKYSDLLHKYPNAIFDKDTSSKALDRKNNNVVKFSNNSEFLRFFELGHSAQELLRLMDISLNNLANAKLKLKKTFLELTGRFEVAIMENLDSSTAYSRNVLRGGLGYYREFPRIKHDYTQDDLKCFFGDMNLYFNFSQKLEGVPAVISPVISTKFLAKFKDIINQPKSYKMIIEDMAKEVNVAPCQLLIVDRELRGELVPLPNIQREFVPQEISTELHYFYYVDRPEFDDYLACKAQIDGLRPVMAHKRQEQYYHVFNTLHKDDFNGFDEYLEILSNHHAQEAQLHYDDFYKASNSGILHIMETMVSNFEYIYINSTNSLWHCTQKLKARQFLLAEVSKELT